VETWGGEIPYWWRRGRLELYATEIFPITSGRGELWQCCSNSSASEIFPLVNHYVSFESRTLGESEGDLNVPNHKVKKTTGLICILSQHVTFLSGSVRKEFESPYVGVSDQFPNFSSRRSS